MAKQPSEGMAGEWTRVIDGLIDKEQYTSLRPFPIRQFDAISQKRAEIPQIALKNPSVHVICKIADDFATKQQFAVDEETIPAKVLCWNNISTLDIRLTTKAVKAGLDAQYRRILDDITISFQSVSTGNRDPIPTGQSQNPELIIYHVLDPAVTRKTRITPAALVMKPRKRKVASSGSSPELSAYLSPVTELVRQPVIQDDITGLERLGNEIRGRAVFILDCSFADKALSILRQMNQNYMIFAATSDALLYSPRLPCDLFTSCLLTPGKMALLWQSQSYATIGSGLLAEIEIQTLIDMMNESGSTTGIINVLEEALSAYVVRMAYDAMHEDDVELFYSLFRKDPITGRLFGNFLFATRVMRAFSIQPLSHPVMPDLTNHPLWDAFELQIDKALYAMKESLAPTPVSFFSYEELLEEHMIRLDAWLWFPNRHRPAPVELPFIDLLLSVPKFFKRAIAFSARYVQISPETVQFFLNTRAMPMLPGLMRDDLLTDSETLVNFAHVIINCVVVQSSVKSLFEDLVEFWVDRVNNDDPNVQAAVLRCLLIFASLSGKIDLYRSRNLDVFIKTLTTSTAVDVAPLAHMILALMEVPLELPVAKIERERVPFGRAALVARIAVTLMSTEMDDESRVAMLIDLIFSLNDCSSHVREEVLIVLSDILSHDPSQFRMCFERLIQGRNAVSMEDGVYLLLIRELQILQFEPSRQVVTRLREFLAFLEQTFIDTTKSQAPLTSDFPRILAAKVSQEPSASLRSREFPARALVSGTPLIGNPAISAGGLFACGDNTGRVMWQRIHRPDVVYDEFTKALDVSDVPSHFSSILDFSHAREVVASYIVFADDSSIMAVTNRSQVVVVNANEPMEVSAAFWMAPPDACERVVVNYNHMTSRLLQSTGIARARVFDLETGQVSSEVRLGMSPITTMQWLRPFAPLFTVAQGDLSLYDTRTSQNVASLSGAGVDLLDCNGSWAAPSYLLAGYENGTVSMIDLRMMEVLCTCRADCPVTQFDVHSQLPFCIGATSQDILSFTWDGGALSVDEQSLRLTSEGFALHQTEPSCAIRVGDRVHGVIIDY